jgi:cytochrome c553
VNIRIGFVISGISGLALMAISSMAFGQNGREVAPRIVTWNCSGCHGVDGKAQLQHFPSLAALDASYIEQRIAAFQAVPAPPSGELLYWFVKPDSARKVNASSTPEARADMVGIAHAITPRETKAAAAWYSTRQPAPVHSVDAARAEGGKALYVKGLPAKGVASCQDCHGGPGVQASAPRLAGQNDGYLANQLRRIRTGSRAHPAEMTSSTTRLDDQQIRAVAAYLASQ